MRVCARSRGHSEDGQKKAASGESPGAGTDPPPAFPGFVRFLYLINLSSYFFELRIVKL